jgi:DNA-binding beta-propeller fold protein YncE
MRLPPVLAAAGIFLLAAAASLAFAAPSALAATPPNGPSHLLAFSFGSETSSVKDPYPLSAPTAVAEDRASHDLYVTDPGNHRVEKFNEKGEFVLMFGQEVDKTAVETPGRQSEVNVCPAPGHSTDKCQAGTPGPGPGAFESPALIAVDNSNGPTAGDVYVVSARSELIQRFKPSGQLDTSWGHEGQFNPGMGVIEYIAVDASGNLYVTHINEHRFSPSATEIFPELIPRDAEYSVLNVSPLDHGGVITPNPIYAYNPAESQLYVDTGSVVDHEVCTQIPFYEFIEEAGGFQRSRDSRALTCQLLDAFPTPPLLSPSGIAVRPDTNRLYAATTGADDVAAFDDVRPSATTGPPTATTETSVTLTGHLAPETHGENHGPIVKCFFEWGFSTAYGHTVPCEGFTTATAPTDVSATIAGLQPITELPIGTTYHYRLVVENEKVAPNELGATAEGEDETALTTAPPQIEGVSSSHLTATSAQLNATIKPNLLPTTYFFQYGTTTAYGQTTPQTTLEGDVEELEQAHEVHINLEGLQPGATYHFRLIAKNQLGEKVSEDHTFEFFPPSCPNSAVRQQTGSAYLPDCRAYELVSPSNANGTLLYPGGPETGLATSPSRFTFSAKFGSPTGADTSDTGGDLYVSTRTDTGWVTHYLGLPGSQAACQGGPPTEPGSTATFGTPGILTDTVPTDPSMSRFLVFVDGGAAECEGSPYFVEGSKELDPPSNAPYLFTAEGTNLGRLPTDSASTPAALEAFRCPYPANSPLDYRGECSGETTASPDLSQLIFSSRTASFAEPPEEGLTVAPGSAYEDDLATGKVELISKLPGTLGGGTIPQDPAFASVPPEFVNGVVRKPGGAEEYLRFPAVSTDGSHVLISTLHEPIIQCNAGEANGGVTSESPCAPFTAALLHLYMRVGGGAGVTYEPSRSEITGENVPVHYVGMTADGSRVYFTSSQQLIPSEVTAGNTELYMWSEEGELQGHPLTLISKPNGGTDAATECDPAPARILNESGELKGQAQPWTEACDAVPYSDYSFAFQGGLIGGNAVSDAAIAQNGDIYFFSPAQLDGTRGQLGQQNLYDYLASAGEVRYVTTLTPEHRESRLQREDSCYQFQNLNKLPASDQNRCSEGPIVRLEVSPDDTHLSFFTASRLTSYDNAGREEVYSYTPATEALTCDSCNPSGTPATADAEASQDGLFMTDDGRTFFSTAESLVPADTNHATDVYEFVDGRPQLITPGTGTGTGESNGFTKPGLIGVSANGTDVYFSTFDVLISEDQNGDFLKFYDARTDGGFPQPPPTQPCAAAEECHGPGTEPPALPTQGTAATLAGGNATPEHQSKHHNKKHKKHKAKHHKRAHKRRAAHNNRRAAR